jgi:hypothetical protein
MKPAAEMLSLCTIFKNEERLLSRCLDSARDHIGILKEEIAAGRGDDSRLDFLLTEYHQLGLFDQAAEVAERIVAARPLDPQAHLHAGVYHLVYKVDRHRARADFMAALRLRPGYSEAQAFFHLMEEQDREAANQMPLPVPVRKLYINCGESW